MSAMNAVTQLMGRIKEMAENDRQKIGGMTLGASARLGLAELRDAVAIDGSVSDRTQTPLGMYGTLTPGEISAARQETTAQGPQIAAEDSEKQNGTSNDPVAVAQRQTTASNDVTQGRDDKGLSR